MTWLLYGACGFTGRLVAELATERGERPVLAGRSAGKVAELAGRLEPNGRSGRPGTPNPIPFTRATPPDAQSGRLAA